MRRAPALLALALCASASAGCPKEVKKTVVVPPNPMDPKLADHERLQLGLKQQQSKYQQTLEAYEKKKQEYQLAVAAQMVTSKADKRSIQQIQDMSRDAQRIGSELLSAVEKLNEALLERAEAAHKLWGVEARLFDEEYRVFGSRESAAARAIVEVKYLHETETELRQAQKEQQESLAKLREEELAAWTQIGADTGLRDQADQRLNVQRDAVDKSFVKLLDYAQRWEDAADRMHRKIQQGAVTTDHEIGTKIQQLIDRRTRYAKELAIARQHLKDATMLRADKRSQEVSYDGEFDVVIARAFKTDALRENFLARVKAQKDPMVATRATMLEEEKALAGLRKRLVTLEAEIAGLGY